MRKLRKIQVAIVLLSVCLTVSTARSSTVSNFSVNATVVASCISSATSITFDYQGQASGTGPQNGVGNISITCKRSLAYHVDISNGKNATGQLAVTRLMTDGLSYVRYNLYTSRACDRVWGSGMRGGISIASEGTGAAQAVGVYARIPATSVAGGGVLSDISQPIEDKVEDSVVVVVMF